MKVIVIGRGSVEFKGKLYLPGDALALPDEEAKRLIGKGKVAEEPKEIKVSKETKETKEK